MKGGVKMLKNYFNNKKDELNGIINYFSTTRDLPEDENEKKTALGTIALRLEEIAEDNVEYSPEEKKELLQLSVEGLRSIADSTISKRT